MNTKISYEDSGVSIDKGNQFIEKIKKDVNSTKDKNVIGGIGSFAGAYLLPSGYKEPVILSATDGVGTKLRLAIENNKLDTVGIDLVAMCVNDLICNMGTPMFFLDYYATGKLIPENASKVVKGIANGCKEAECSLVGGETAEMPGMYSNKDFDLAGFAVGVAERSEIDTLSNVKEGQVLVAIPSSGIHSNGYSLVRKIIEEKGIDINDPFNGSGKNLIDVLLEPTRIYVKEFKSNKKRIKALCHITGGGIVENLPRALPDGLTARIKKEKMRVLPIFKFLGKYVSEEEMFRTFNMGIGMIWIVDKEDVFDTLIDVDDSYVIGKIIKGEKGVTFI